jgi:hypothetical protein
MEYPSLNYVEVSFNGANNRNVILPVTDVAKNIPKDGADHYAVMFRYEATLKRHVDETGSVKGHDLPCYPDYITFDIDEKDLETAQGQTIKLIEKLEMLGIESDKIGLSFSGAKGFHVLVPSTMFGVQASTNNARFMRELCKGIAGDDIKLDYAIYDKNRLFRIRNTKNSKSGLFKVDIPISMLYAGIDTITGYATEPRIAVRPANNFPARDNLTALWKKAQAVNLKERVIGSAPSLVVPRYAKACIHKILQGVSDGLIHNSAFRVANHFYKQGFPANVIKGILEGWGPLNQVPAEEDFNRMAKEAGDYDFGCNDEILKSFCDPKCYLYKQTQVDTSDIMDFDAQFKSYIEHIRNLKKACFVTGFDDLDIEIRGVAPGEVMFIVAYSGLFKSALLQNLLLQAGKRTGEHHLFFSLEMPVSRVFERSAQMMTDTEGYTIENNFKDPEFQKELYKKMVMQNANKLLVCQKGGLTIEQVKDYTIMAREKYGNIGAIGIDYLGLMTAKGKQSEYDRISYCAEQSKHLAKELNIPVIMLAQVNRAAAGAEVEKWSGKGSGAIEASADFMIGLQKDETEQLVLKLLKNRKGKENLNYIVEMERNYLKFVKLLPADDQTEKRSSKKGKLQRVTKHYTEKESNPYEDPQCKH